MAKITRQYIISVAESIRGTYLMGGAGPSQWDCSGFVGHCVGAAIGSRYFATGGEGSWLGSHGFSDVTNNVNMTTGDGMEQGDILIWNKEGGTGLYADGHTEIYWGDGCTIGARGPRGSVVGLPGGTRVVSRVPWQQCWRAPSNVAFLQWIPWKKGAKK